MANSNVNTIVSVIKMVLSEASKPLTADEVYHRILAADLYSFGAINPKGVVQGKIRRHTIGLDFPSAHPIKYFRLVGEDKYELASLDGVVTNPTPKASTTPLKSDAKNTTIPEEIIDNAHKEHLSMLRQELKDKILNNNPVFFERLVIELLIRMGFGGGDAKLGFHTGGPGDGGIDGIIREDKLGLDQIYIQAKRYALDREVKRTDVQRFAGAMNKVSKGVFITTASFATSARSFANGHQKTISLIDGDFLCDLMIMHGVGTSEIKTYRVLRVDNDFFSPSD